MICINKTRPQRNRQVRLQLDIDDQLSIRILLLLVASNVFRRIFQCSAVNLFSDHNTMINASYSLTEKGDLSWKSVDL